MDTAWVVLATLLMSFAGGLVPLINVEVWLIGVSTVCPRAALLPVVLAASLGQVAAKVMLYQMGAGAAGYGFRKGGARLERTVQRLRGGASRGEGLVFASALTGVPPFYLVSLAAGVVRLRLFRFLVLALVGRILRFAFVFLLPRVSSIVEALS
jgi:membrane protein YqaA with SNARE-associated domain